MPKLKFEAKRFNAYPPTKKLTPKAKGKLKTGEENFTTSELVAHAMVVGDSSALSGGFDRPALQMVWRMAMVLDCLAEEQGFFVKSQSYLRLDPSEKSAISYFLGLVQCSMMAERILGAGSTVHVDVLLKIRGMALPPEKRPDLVGYRRRLSNGAPVPGWSASGQFLFEAKGRSGPRDKQVLKNAKNQLRNPPGHVLGLVGRRPITAASIAHFKAASYRRGAPVGPEMWSSYLEDPPPRRARRASEFTDEELAGLISLAQLLPVCLAMRDLERATTSSRLRKEEGLVCMKLPYGEHIVAIREPLWRVVEKVDHLLVDDYQLKRISRDIAAIIQDPFPLSHHEIGSSSLHKDGGEAEGLEVAELPSGLVVLKGEDF